MDATKEYDIEHHDELVERFIAKHSSEYWQFVASMVLNCFCRHCGSIMDETKEYDIEHHNELVERFIAKHSSEYWQFVASELYGE